MNILILDKDPKKCGSYYSDRHVLNYIITYCQFLSTAHWISLYSKEEEDTYFEKFKDMKNFLFEKYPIGNSCRPPYGINYLNNSCTEWLCYSKQNYLWLCDLLSSLCEQYEFRYDKTHKCKEYINWFKNNIPESIVDGELTNFSNNVPDSCKISSDVVECYRNFYKTHKKEKAKYKKNNKPEWL